MPNFNTDTEFLSNQNVERMSDPNSNCSTFKEESLSKRCWRRFKTIRGLGLVLVILKNLLAIIADSVVKKIDNIGKYAIANIWIEMQRILHFLLFRFCQPNILPKPHHVDNNNELEYCQRPTSISGGTLKKRQSSPSGQAIFSVDFKMKIFSKVLINRCLISGVHVMAAYFALQQMPLSVQKLIISARPIFTVILARIFLKEPFGKIDVSLF